MCSDLRSQLLFSSQDLRPCPRTQGPGPLRAWGPGGQATSFVLFFVFSQFWFRLVFWQGSSCLMFSSKVLCSVPKSSVQFQSLLFSSKVLCSVPKVLCSVPKVLCSVPKSYVQFQSLMFSSKSLMFSSQSLMFSSQSLMFSSQSLMFR